MILCSIWQLDLFNLFFILKTLIWRIYFVKNVSRWKRWLTRWWFWSILLMRISIDTFGWITSKLFIRKFRILYWFKFQNILKHHIALLSYIHSRIFIFIIYLLLFLKWFYVWVICFSYDIGSVLILIFIAFFRLFLFLILF